MNDEKKNVSSAIGMKRSMETSEFLQYRIRQTVPERTNKIHQAIVEKDFKTFAELTMKDSNQMHAVCLDTYPPCIYMNDTSNSIINLIHSYNDAVNDVKVRNIFIIYILHFFINYSMKLVLDIFLFSLKKIARLLTLLTLGGMLHYIC